MPLHPNQPLNTITPATFTRLFQPIPTPDGSDIRSHHEIRNEPFDHIWTITEDDGSWNLTNGYHYVNRIGYVITRRASPDATIVVPHY